MKESHKSLDESLGITQPALSGAEDFETMKSAFEDLGVVNSEMVAFDALIKNTEALKEAGLDLAEATDEDAEIRKLEKQQDALGKQIDAIQEMLDASNEYWDAQIEQTEKYYDTMIKGMEEYKSRWEELSDLQEHAEMVALLKELGLTEEDLLNESSGAFDRLRTSYLGILKDLNTGNQGVLDGLSQLANVDMGNIPSFLAEMQGYVDSMANMDVTALADGLSNAASRV